MKTKETIHMYEIIKRYVENGKENGLLLVDMPTGSGKTYSAVNYIFDSCMNPENKDRKYIFVTTLKKNLPYENLRKKFANAGNETLFKEKVLLIDSNMDCVVEGWSEDIEKDIPYELKQLEEFKRFRSDVNFVKKQREKKDPMLREYLPSVETNLREKTEPQFREKISEYIDKEYRTVEQRIYAIKTESKWQWIAKLYPAVFTKDRQVLLMSMDKFLSRNTTIVEPSYLFYNSDIIKNAVIFIDEFDATKDTILKKIINEGLKDKIDYIALFKSIYSALHTDEFPTDLTTPSKKRMEGDYNWQSLDSVIEGVKEKADYIYSTYSLQFKHRTTEELSDTYQNYLFQDHQFHSILNGNNSYITMHSDMKRKINSIDFSEDKPQVESNNIHVMLGQIGGFIKYFRGAVNILAINYMQCKREKHKDGEDVFTMEAAIRSVLDLFRLSKENIDYLTAQIIMEPYKSKDGIQSAQYDLSLYENGFRYYAFENDSEHDMQSQIMMYSFGNTPEKILLRFCDKAKVIGISATATVPSVIGNFDIDHIKRRMQQLYAEITDEDRKRFTEEFNSQQKGYKDVNIHVELIGDKDGYSRKSWDRIFASAELAQKYYEKIQRLFGENEDDNDYKKKRYFRIAFAFKQFVMHEDIYSFLCVLNKHPKSGDRDLNKDILFEIFKSVATENHFTYGDNKTVAFLDGSEYEDKKNNVIERLAKGEKIFVISVYQTIGAGQNLQYTVPEFLNGKLVKTNNRNLGKEKDFDAIYLDKPTNLIVPFSDNMEESEFVKYIFQMEYLQESTEISSYAAMLNIKKAFKTYMMGRKNFDKFEKVLGKQSVMLLSTRYIIQAIGRICRTNQKNKDIYIFADESIAESLDVSVVEGRIFNPEFIELVDAIKKAGAKSPEAASLENGAHLKSVRVNKRINNMLNNNWTESKISEWKKLRQLVLKSPTASEEEAKSNFIINNYYLNLPAANDRYFYSQIEDYNNVSVSFSQDKEHPLMVSAEGTKLRDMLRIPGVAEMFRDKGYATSFEPNDYIMTPPLWNNIYKGALGEEVGKFLLEKVLEVPVKEIEDPDKFELFDFEIDGCSIYVDFKNWHEGLTVDKKEMLRKIREKAKRCGCKCVVVANIFATGEWDFADDTVDDVRIVSLPCLVKNEDDKLSYDRKSWDLLRECVDEYRNQD